MKDGKLKITGFTMIELLIVIAVLGVLAVAVLSAINPIEQINRGKDTGTQSDAEQLLSAIDRYYTAQSIWPWQVDASDTNKAVSWNDVTDLSDSAGTPVLNKLSAGGAAEIKASFVKRLQGPTYNPLKIYFSGQDGDSVYICFDPVSSSFDEIAGRRCSSGLPDDLQAINDTICSQAGNYYSCLP